MSLEITTTALDLAFRGEVYRFELKALCKPARSVTWTCSEDTPFPSGLEFSADGIVTGSPKRVGRTSVTVSVSAHDPDETDSKTFNINIYEPLAIEQEDSISIAMKQNSAFSFKAKGGIPPYKWTTDSLPIGLKTENGILRGNPQVSGGKSPIVLTVEDSIGKKCTKVVNIIITP